MELFCKKKTVQDISFFTNEIVPELYDHNFILVENISNETETIECIREQLKVLAQSDKGHLKIVIHPGLEVSREFYDDMNDAGLKRQLHQKILVKCLSFISFTWIVIIKRLAVVR